jgi:formiminotetrahydrofolate cyclodeaminase
MYLLIEKTIQEFLEEISSISPAPGGGSVAALGGALSASLLSMVSKLSIGKKKYPQLENEMIECLAESEDLRKSMTSSVDEDTAAFNELMAAYKVNKTCLKYDNHRAGGDREALRRTINVPLKVAKGCATLLKLANMVASKGNKNAISDTGVAALMAYAALQGAIYNVRINLLNIKDSGFKSRTYYMINQLMKEGEDYYNKALITIEVELRG